MSISDGGYSVADVRIAGITGVRGIGFSRLHFSVEFNIRGHGERPPARIATPIAHIHAGRSQSEVQPLGVAAFETHWFAEQHPQPHRDGIGAYLDLSGEQLEALERMREGGSLFFKLDLRVLLDRPGRGIERGDEQVWFEANPSVWSKVLEQLGYLELLLVALELPIEDFPPELGTAIDQIRTGHAELVAGRYDAVVRSVRLALDAVETILGSKEIRSRAMKAFSANKETREQMPKRDRAHLVRAAIRHYTHLAHHVDDDGYVEFFGRNDAMFVLGAAAAAIWDAIAELKQPAPNDETDAIE